MSQVYRKTTFWLTDGSGPQRIEIPVGIIKGKGPGPLFVVMAGVHGAEYPPILASQQVFHELDPGRVKGTVKFVFIANMCAYKKRAAFINPIDGKNLNRVFPGRADGTHSERVARIIWKEVVSGSQFLVDLHCGDVVEELLPFSLICNSHSSREIGPKSLELARNFPTRYVVQQSAGSADWDNTGTTCRAGSDAGIVSAIVEAGGRGLVEEEAIKILAGGLKNALKWAGILDGVPGIIDKPVILRRFTWVRTPLEGTFIAAVGVGDRIGQGQIVGQMQDYFGNHVRDIHSPVSGIVLFKTTSPSMAENGLLMGVGDVSGP